MSKMQIKVELRELDRESVQRKVSDSLGSYIMGLERTDFATWTPEEWGDMCAIAFDVVAVEVFRHRIMIAPPYVEEVAPPF